MSLEEDKNKNQEQEPEQEHGRRGSGAGSRHGRIKHAQTRGLAAEGAAPPVGAAAAACALCFLRPVIPIIILCAALSPSGGGRSRR